MAYALPPEWTFESTVTRPDNVRVTTTITVPVDAEWSDVRECSELSQMGANWTLGHVLKSIESSAKRGAADKKKPGFDEEPPF